MSASARSTRQQNVAFYILACLIALGSLNSKLLGAAWATFCMLGFYLAFRNRNIPPHTHDNVVVAASIWFISCVIALLLSLMSFVIWHEWDATLNTELRLLLAAAAVICLLRRYRLSSGKQHGLLHAAGWACVFAFAWTIGLTIQSPDTSLRTSLASNAIAWAVGISFYICLLLPATLSKQYSPQQRLFWLLSIGCGLGAILMSQSRGAFLIIPWCLLVYVWFQYQTHRRYSSWSRPLVTLVATVIVVLATAWFAPGDVLRLHQATQDIEEVRDSGNYNSSIGARIYLWRMAIDGIRSSPWIGIGSAERTRRIKHAGKDKQGELAAKLEEVRALGHVHNQYLHAALDGGAIGLASVLTLLLGMALAILHLRRTSMVAAWQLGGVLFMHATASLTNVNFAHNYYATALALAVVMPLLSAQHKSTPLENS